MKTLLLATVLMVLVAGCGGSAGSGGDNSKSGDNSSEDPHYEDCQKHLDCLNERSIEFSGFPLSESWQKPFMEYCMGQSDECYQLCFQAALDMNTCEYDFYPAGPGDPLYDCAAVDEMNTNNDCAGFGYD